MHTFTWKEERSVTHACAIARPFVIKAVFA
jgi:hypothetical protein